MKKTLKNPAEGAIPAHALKQIKALSSAHDVLDIKTDCAKAKLKNAIAAGNATAAIKAKQDGRKLMVEFKKAHEGLWGAIYQAMPHLDKDESYAIDVEEWTVAPSESENPMSGFARMFNNG